MTDEPTARGEDAARAQEERAIRAINAIFSGGDLAEETLRLSNEFTDRQESRLRAFLSRAKRS